MAITISELPAGSNPIGTEIAPFVQGGQTVSLSVDQVISLVTLAGLGGVTAAQVITEIETLVNQAYIGAKLWPQTPVEAANSVTPTTLNFPPYTSFRYMTTAQITDVMAGTLTLDVTTALVTMCSIKQASGGVYARFLPGTYGIKTGFTIATPGTYDFRGAVFVPTATTSQPYLLQWQAGFSTTYGLTIQGAYNTNYAAGVLWNSLGSISPAQSNNHYDLTINRLLGGLVFGAVSTPASAVQSENYIHGCHITECQNPLLINQPNGILRIIGGDVNCDNGSWSGGFTPASSNVIAVGSGAVSLHGCDVEKPAITVGDGIVNTGGSIQIDGGSWEIAGRNLTLAGGSTNISNIAGEFWNNATTSWAVMNGALTSSPTLRISNFVLNKTAGTYNSPTAFVDLGGFTGWGVDLSDLRLENMANVIFNNGSSQANMWTGNTVTMKNVESPNVGAAGTPTYSRVSFDVNNLLDVIACDYIGNDIATWWKLDVTGTGAIALNADVPAGQGYVNSIQCTPQASDASGVYTLDLASLTTVRSTGFQCRPGDTFWLSLWARMTTSGTAAVNAVYANSGGTLQTTIPLIDNTTLLTNAWQLLYMFISVPTGCNYLGVGMGGTGGTVVRLVGVKLSKMLTQ